MVKNLENCYLLVKTLRRKPIARLIDYIKVNQNITLTAIELQKVSKLNYPRHREYLADLELLGLIHRKMEGQEELVFFDHDRYNVCKSTLEYLEKAIEKRSNERDREIYG